MRYRELLKVVIFDTPKACRKLPLPLLSASYLSLHPSLFSVRVAGLTAYHFTSRGRSQVLGNKESMELGMEMLFKLALAYSITVAQKNVPMFA